MGGQRSYASSKYSASYYGYGYIYKVSATYIGARGSYHLNDALNINSKFDLYGGLSLGYVVVNLSDSDAMPQA
ncbi:hypothetical protein [Mucilaginibacter gracilis]|uniref:hypothetical protein n=1 Tax=Mucilaginibacter gracilis TaxID=423350 RepID=UPI000EAE3BF5|nr:hypothetical protein [Mucilaginibacter gracilis]